ncbi:MAG: hypothetical protein ACI4PY_03685 [Akkermansia muciniphila]
MKHPLLLLLPAALLLAGCNLQKLVDRKSAELAAQYDRQPLWEELPVRTISWNQALAMMARNNAEIQRLDQQIAQSKRDETSVYTDLIPGMSFYTYMNTSLHDLARRLPSDNVNSSINVTFNLPQLTQLPYRVYSAKVTSFANIKAREGKDREITAALYKAVRQAELNEKLAALDKEQETPEDSPEEQFKRAKSDTENWQMMAKTLGDYSARWVILPSGVPHVTWEYYRDKVTRLDPLVICGFVMQLEKARMAQYSIMLQYLPTINTSLYSPSLFSSTGGTYSGTFMDSRDTKISLSVSYTLDTKLRTWDSYQRSKMEYDLAKREVRASMFEHKVKLSQLMNSVKEYHNWRAYMHKRIAHLEKSIPQNATEYLERRNGLIKMRRELIQQEINSLESEAALVLEYGMPGESSR